MRAQDEALQRIRIGPITYEVVIVTGLKDDDNQTDLHGQADDLYRQIRLNDPQTPDARFATLWHETLHCLESIYGIELPEQEVTALASIIAQILQDNPKMNWPQSSPEGEVIDG